MSPDSAESPPAEQSRPGGNGWAQLLSTLFFLGNATHHPSTLILLVPACTPGPFPRHLRGAFPAPGGVRTFPGALIICHWRLAEAILSPLGLSSPNPSPGTVSSTRAGTVLPVHRVEAQSPSHGLTPSLPLRPPRPHSWLVIQLSQVHVMCQVPEKRKRIRRDSGPSMWH